MTHISKTVLSVFLLCLSCSQAVTIREVVDTWPDLREFQGGRHAFAMNPAAYIFQIKGHKYRLEYATYDRLDEKKMDIVSQAGSVKTGLYTQLGVNAQSGGPLQVPTLYYQQTNEEAAAGTYYRFSFRPERFAGPHPDLDTRHDMMTFLNAAGLHQMKPSPYVWRAPGDNHCDYRRKIEGQENELRLVYLFGYEGRFEDFAAEYDIWNMPAKEINQDGRNLRLWLYPSSKGVYATETEKNLAERLKADNIQVMISVRNHGGLD